MANSQDRYVKLTTRKLADGRAVYASVKPKKINADPLTDISIPASDISRMDVIANNVYGSAQEWWRLASANGRVNGTMYLSPGNKIIIPRA